MVFFKKLFRTEEKAVAPQLPPWEKIVEIMHEKNPDGYADEVVAVIYSKDRSMRYVILHGEKGFFTYQLEVLYPYDEDEWSFIGTDRDALPAMWEPYSGAAGKSLFEKEEELLKELREEPAYKLYF